jgi:hypothetical protein
MLQCSINDAAMQTIGWLLASGIHNLVSDTTRLRVTLKGTFQMSKTASLHLSPSASLFSRFMATLDRVLMVSARAAIRNGDLPYFGL